MGLVDSCTQDIDLAGLGGDLEQAVQQVEDTARGNLQELPAREDSPDLRNFVVGNPVGKVVGLLDRFGW